MKKVINLLVLALLGMLPLLWGCGADTSPNRPIEGTPLLEDIATLETTSATATATATKTPIPTPSPTVTPSPTPTSLPGIETVQQLREAKIPHQDLNELAHRFGRVSDEAPEIGNNFNLNDTDQFWVVDNSVEPPRQFQITAQVMHITDHSYWWVQEGHTVSQESIKSSAEAFETHIYPTNHQFFGVEASPGIDNDSRVHIVMGQIPGVAGYFSAVNEYSQAVVEHSNQREMFLINLNAIRPGQTQFESVLAHEFQHMIHWQQDPNEDAWVNEGLSELAKFVNGYGQSSFTLTYMQQPDIQLTSWGRESAIRRANYGASFLFSLYLYDKFGPEFIKKLVAHPDNGIVGIEQTLAQVEASTTFDQLFADFIIANYLNDPTLAEGQWGYALPDLDFLPAAKLKSKHNSFPVLITNTVKQYGVNYIEINATVPVTITFSGPNTVTLLNNQAHSGQYQWYGNRADNAATRLTRAFDLRDLTEATLHFWTWYDIEKDWDYAYVTISSDQGATWDILQATNSTTTNPVGNAYGAAFTGQSASPLQWVEETVDLSPYVGQEVLLRFEYITDDAVNLPGFAVDDISIPQLGYTYDAEQADDTWQASGFIRTDNILPQQFKVQIIKFLADGQPVVEQMLLDEYNKGQYSLQGLGQTLDKAVLVISAQAPVTTNPAVYSYTINQN